MTEPSDTPTPRTDAFICDTMNPTDGPLGAMLQALNFARQLERDLAAARAEVELLTHQRDTFRTKDKRYHENMRDRDRLAAELTKTQAWGDRVLSEAHSAEAECAALKQLARRVCDRVDQQVMPSYKLVNAARALRNAISPPLGDAALAQEKK